MADSWAASAIVTLCAGLFGSALVPTVIYIGQQRAARTHATADLLREFNAAEMSRARRNAQSLTPNSPTLSEAEKEHFYEIARFYHRLNAMRKADILRDDLLFNFFAQDFAYWWEYALECLDEQSRTRNDSSALKQFFDRQSIMKGASDEWATWLIKGQEDRAARHTPLH